DGKKKELKDKEDVDAILNKIKGNEFNIDKVNRRERKRNPAKPFITSSLQQDAARSINFRARKTMMVAQQLYEGIDLGKEAGGITGLITYMRTDSTRISDTAKNEAKEHIEKEYGKSYLGDVKQAKQKEGSQDAHEAIRPTSAMRTPESLKSVLSNDQYKLYRLIYNRFLASQMAPAIMDTMTIHLKNNGVEFRANGSKIKFDGFMKIYIEGTDNENEEKEEFLPEMEEGEDVNVKDIEPKQHFTQPPPRYTEATLVGTMEKQGKGRPSTCAPTLDTIQKSRYVTLEDRRFVPTEIGEIVLDLLVEYLPEITDVEFTVKMEKDLDEIEEGK